MAKRVDDSVLDGALNVVKNGATQLCICTQEPTTYAEAVTTYNLGTKTGLTSGSYTGPVNGDVSGRKLTKNAETAISATASGNATHAALCSGTVLLYVTTITSQAVTSGNTINSPAFDIEFTDPT